MPSAHDEPEYQTRRQRIDPLLEAQGWTIVLFDPARPLSAYTRHAVTEYLDQHDALAAPRAARAIPITTTRGGSPR